MKYAAILILTLCLTLEDQAQQASNLQMQTPAPASPVASGNVVGNNGNQTYFYYVIARYPGGASISTPVQVLNAPATLSSGNYVTLGWSGLIGATGYDVIRLLQPNFNGTSCTSCGIASNTSATSLSDQNNSPSSYTAPALSVVANGTLYVNNRDYTPPQLRQIINNVDKAVGTGNANIVATTNVLVGDGTGNAVAATGTGTNCVFVNGSSGSCGGGSTAPATFNNTPLTASAPTVVVEGPTGAATWSYAVVGWTCAADGLNSAVSTVTTVSANSSGLNNAITVPNTPAAFLFYDVWLQNTSAGSGLFVTGPLAFGLSPGATFYDTTGTPIQTPSYPGYGPTVNRTVGGCVNGSFFVNGALRALGPARVTGTLPTQSNQIETAGGNENSPVASTLAVQSQLDGDLLGPQALAGYAALDVETNLIHTGTGGAYVVGILNQATFEFTTGSGGDSIGAYGRDNNISLTGDLAGLDFFGSDDYAQNFSVYPLANLIGDEQIIFHQPSDNGDHLLSFGAAYRAIVDPESSCTTCMAVYAALHPIFGTGTGTVAEYDNYKSDFLAGFGVSYTDINGILLNSPDGLFTTVGQYYAVNQQGTTDKSLFQGIVEQGLIEGTGSAPGISGCNSATIASTSTNVAGTITAEATGTCTIALTFAGSQAFAHNATIWVQNQTHPGATNALTQTTSTTGSVTFSGTTVAGDVLRYGVLGN